MLAHPDQHFGCITYSQHGEDLMLCNLFKQLQIDKPSYLDLGAHHPSIISNTKLLYDRGSSGVNVEANPNLIPAFLEQRPRDKTINVGVGLEEGFFDFYMYSDSSGRNTFSLEELNRVQSETTLKLQKCIPLKLVTLNSVVDQYCDGVFPHLLSCDIEGLDFDILHKCDFSKNSPVIICVETRINQTHQMSEMLREKGYSPYCRMGENILFVKDCYARILEKFLV